MQKLIAILKYIPVNQILLLFIGGSVLLTSKRLHDADVSMTSSVSSINDTLLRPPPPPPPEPIVVDANSVVNTGTASMTEASVTFVNPKTANIRVCAVGVLKKNSASSVRLVSLPMCGTIDAFETRTIKAPWLAGRALDVCVNDSGSLSWDACSYELINYKVQ